MVIFLALEALWQGLVESEFPWSQKSRRLAAFRGFLEAVEQRCSGAPEDQNQLSQLSLCQWTESNS